MALRRQPLSYRHLFHAGNHGDVLKHATLALLVGQSLRRHGHGVLFIDTHSGPGGAYDLTSDFAAKRKEYRAGVGRVYDIARIAAQNPHITRLSYLNPVPPIVNANAANTTARSSPPSSASAAAAAADSGSGAAAGSGAGAGRVCDGSSPFPSPHGPLPFPLASHTALYLPLHSPASDLYDAAPHREGWAVPAAGAPLVPRLHARAALLEAVSSAGSDGGGHASSDLSNSISNSSINATAHASASTGLTAAEARAAAVARALALTPLLSQPPDPAYVDAVHRSMLSLHGIAPAPSSSSSAAQAQSADSSSSKSNTDPSDSSSSLPADDKGKGSRRANNTQSAGADFASHLPAPPASLLYAHSPSTAPLAAYMHRHLPLPPSLAPYLALLSAANRAPALSTLAELPDPDALPLSDADRRTAHPYKLRGLERRAARRENDGGQFGHVAAVPHSLRAAAAGAVWGAAGPAARGGAAAAGGPVAVLEDELYGATAIATTSSTTGSHSSGAGAGAEDESAVAALLLRSEAAAVPVYPSSASAVTVTASAGHASFFPAPAPAVSTLSGLTSGGAVDRGALTPAVAASVAAAAGLSPDAARAQAVIDALLPLSPAAAAAAAAVGAGAGGAGAFGGDGAGPGAGRDWEFGAPVSNHSAAGKSGKGKGNTADGDDDDLGLLELADLDHDALGSGPAWQRQARLDALLGEELISSKDKGYHTALRRAAAAAAAAGGNNSYGRDPNTHDTNDDEDGDVELAGVDTRRLSPLQAAAARTQARARGALRDAEREDRFRSPFGTSAPSTDSNNSNNSGSSDGSAAFGKREYRGGQARAGDAAAAAKAGLPFEHGRWGGMSPKGRSEPQRSARDDARDGARDGTRDGTRESTREGTRGFVDREQRGPRDRPSDREQQRGSGDREQRSFSPRGGDRGGDREQRSFGDREPRGPRDREQPQHQRRSPAAASWPSSHNAEADSIPSHTNRGNMRGDREQRPRSSDREQRFGDREPRFGSGDREQRARNESSLRSHERIDNSWRKPPSASSNSSSSSNNNSSSNSSGSGSSGNSASSGSSSISASAASASASAPAAAHAAAAERPAVGTKLSPYFTLVKRGYASAASRPYTYGHNHGQGQGQGHGGRESASAAAARIFPPAAAAAVTARSAFPTTAAAATLGARGPLGGQWLAMRASPSRLALLSQSASLSLTRRARSMALMPRFTHAHSNPVSNSEASAVNAEASREMSYNARNNSGRDRDGDRDSGRERDSDREQGQATVGNVWQQLAQKQKTQQRQQLQRPHTHAHSPSQTGSATKKFGNAGSHKNTRDHEYKNASRSQSSPYGSSSNANSSLGRNFDRDSAPAKPSPSPSPASASSPRNVLAFGASAAAADPWAAASEAALSNRATAERKFPMYQSHSRLRTSLSPLGAHSSHANSDGYDSGDAASAAAESESARASAAAARLVAAERARLAATLPFAADGRLDAEAQITGHTTLADTAATAAASAAASAGLSPLQLQQQGQDAYEPSAFPDLRYVSSARYTLADEALTYAPAPYPTAATAANADSSAAFSASAAAARGGALVLETAPLNDTRHSASAAAAAATAAQAAAQAAARSGPPAARKAAAAAAAVAAKDAEAVAARAPAALLPPLGRSALRVTVGEKIELLAQGTYPLTAADASIAAALRLANIPSRNTGTGAGTDTGAGSGGAMGLAAAARALAAAASAAATEAGAQVPAVKGDPAATAVARLRAGFSAATRAPGEPTDDALPSPFTLPQRPRAAVLASLRADFAQHVAELPPRARSLAPLALPVTAPLQRVPSSPFLFTTLARPGRDRVLLSELHTTEFARLLEHYANPSLADTFTDHAQRFAPGRAGSDTQFHHQRDASNGNDGGSEGENDGEVTVSIAGAGVSSVTAVNENAIASNSDMNELPRDPLSAPIASSWFNGGNTRSTSTGRGLRTDSGALASLAADADGARSAPGGVTDAAPVRAARREALQRFLLGPHMPGGLTSGTAVARKNGLHLLQRLARVYREMQEDNPRGLTVRKARKSPTSNTKNFANTKTAANSSSAAASEWETVPAAPPGLVLIDPAYEGAHEFASVLASLRSTLTQWPSACVAVWYPILRPGALLKSELARAQAVRASDHERRAQQALDDERSGVAAQRRAEAQRAREWYSGDNAAALSNAAADGNHSATSSKNAKSEVDKNEDEFEEEIKSFLPADETRALIKAAQAASSDRRTPANERVYESTLIRAFDALPRHRHRDLFLDLARRVATSEEVQRLLRSADNLNGLGDAARARGEQVGALAASKRAFDRGANSGQHSRFSQNNDRNSNSNDRNNRVTHSAAGAVNDDELDESAAAKLLGPTAVRALRGFELDSAADPSRGGGRATAAAAKDTAVVAEVYTNSSGFTIGSGMFIVNPPSAEEVKPQLKELVPWLASALSEDALAAGQAQRETMLTGAPVDESKSGKVADFALEWISLDTMMRQGPPRPKRGVYKPSRTGDAILTTTFFFETMAIAYTIFTTNQFDFYYFLAMFGVTALAVKATTWFCNTVMHDYFSGYVLRDAPFNHPLKKRAARTKFVGTAWQFVIHASMVIFEIYVLHDEDWLSKPWMCFYPNPVDFVPKTSLRLLFVTQIAIWIFTCISHRFNSDAHAHKDYFVMYIHHLATIGLVGLAYADNNFKVGAIVLFVHDISDIGIDTLKMSNYLHLDGKPGLYIVELAYTMTMVMWVYFRLYVFPFFIIGQGSLPSLQRTMDFTFPDGTHAMAARMVAALGDWTPAYTRFYVSGVICNLLLILLFVLHIWWFALLFRILIRMVRTDPHSAGAAEYEGDSDHEDNEPLNSTSTVGSSRGTSPALGPKRVAAAAAAAVIDAPPLTQV